MTQFLVNTSSSAIIFVCVHTSARQTQIFSSRSFVSVEQSDAVCLVRTHFGFGSHPSVFVRVISGNSQRGGGESTMLDNRSYHLAPLSLS